jgi:HD-GYP domain-containing protein (c-di-GMP phosphodiesterase class II)
VGYVVLTSKTLNVDNAYEISDDAPYSFNSKFDQLTHYKTRSMVTVPLRKPSGEVLGALQLINHISPQTGQPTYSAFPPFEISLAESLASQAAVGYNNILLENSLRKANNETLCRLCAAAEFRDPETADHLIRMSHYSRIIAKEFGLSPAQQNLLFEASPMHDIGKIGIPDSILLKPGPLTIEERRVMQSHATIGEKILSGSDSDLVQTCALIAGSHHEKYDGSGYPRGLVGKSIPIEGRIVALADVFDALVSKRVYKAAWNLDTVLEFIRDQSGLHFDPEVVDAFFRGLDEIIATYQRYSPRLDMQDPKIKQTVGGLYS